MSDDETPKPPDRRSRRIFTVAVVGAVGLLVLFALSGRFTFVTKTALVPLLFGIAVLTNRGTPFIKQWSVYLSLLVLFDAVRGYVYYATVALDRKVYMNYAIEAERALLGGRVGPTWLQAELLEPGSVVGFGGKLLTMVHGSHFMFFLLVGLAIWYLRREEFEDFKIGMLMVMGIGLVGYWVVPTVPPWMASIEYGVIPELRRVYVEVYNVAMPQVKSAFDTNPIAAMPSLHTAFPAFITMVVIRIWGLKGLAALAYFLVMAFTLVYGGEHYVVDELAGIVVAVLAYVLTYTLRVQDKMSTFFATRVESSDSRLFRLLDTDIKRKLALSAGILLTAEAMGQISFSGFKPWEPTREFVERELVGRSEIAHLLLGGEAFNAGETAVAQREFELALDELTKPSNVLMARTYLAQSAAANRDFEAVVTAVGDVPVRSLTAPTVAALATAYYELGRRDRATGVFDALERGYPCTVEITLEKNRLGYAYGARAAADVRADIQSLRARFDDPQAHEVARVLEQMLQAGPAPAKPRAVAPSGGG